MASAKKLPSGNWRVNLYIGLDDSGKRKYKSFTADTKKQAEFLAAQYNVDRREQERCELTLRAASERYIESKRNVLSPSTIRGYMSVLRNNLKSLMTIKVEDITQEAIQNEINSMAVNLSSKSCRNAHGFLSAVLAVYRPDFTLHTTLPARERNDIYVPDSVEVARILALAAGSINEIPVFLATQCGLRASEISALKVANIFDDHIEIKEANVLDDKGNEVTKSPKSWSGYRKVPISKETAEYIRNHADGDRVCNRRSINISNNWDKFRAKHGLNKSLNFHALRHHYASRCLLIGIPQKYTAELMGHSSTDMIERVYQHTFPSAMEQFSEKLRVEIVKMQHEMQHGKSEIA